MAILYTLLQLIGSNTYTPQHLIQAFGACVIWGAYLSKSERVRATFVD